MQNTVHPYASSHASSTALVCATEDTENVLLWKRKGAGGGEEGIYFDKGSVPTGTWPMDTLMPCM